LGLINVRPSSVCMHLWVVTPCVLSMVKGRSLELLGKRMHLETLQSPGSERDILADLVSRLEELTCQLYKTHTNIKKVNDTRFNLFCAHCGM